MDEDKITVVFLQAQWKFSKMRPKVQQILMPVCAAIAQRSVLIQPCDLWLITTENVNVKCAAFKLVNMCSDKNCLRLDLLDLEDILLNCSGGTDLVFFELSGCIWSTIQDSKHFSLSLKRCWMVAARLFKFLWPLSCATKFGWTSASRSRPTLVFLTEWLETFFLFVSLSLAEVKASLRNLPISFFPRGLYRYHTLSLGFRRWFMAR